MCGGVVYLGVSRGAPAVRVTSFLVLPTPHPLGAVLPVHRCRVGGIVLINYIFGGKINICGVNVCVDASHSMRGLCSCMVFFIHPYSASTKAAPPMDGTVIGVWQPFHTFPLYVSPERSLDIYNIIDKHAGICQTKFKKSQPGRRAAICLTAHRTSETV